MGLSQQPLSLELIPSWRLRSAIVPKDIFLSMTYCPQCAFGLPDNAIDLARLREAGAIAQLLHFIEAGLPNGFDTYVRKRAVRLSGGQRQRIGLALSLYHRPSLLILDEATSALDVATEARLLEALRALAGTLTMLVSAHRLSAVENCDQLIDLADEIPTVALFHAN
jgi:ATP-binding cassette, subfamily B, bacterial PglK